MWDNILFRNVTQFNCSAAKQCTINTNEETGDRFVKMSLHSFKPLVTSVVRVVAIMDYIVRNGFYRCETALFKPDGDLRQHMISCISGGWCLCIVQ